MRRKKRQEHTSIIGFTVKAGRMTSLGSAGAIFVNPGTPLWEEAQHYRSESGIGRPYDEYTPPNQSGHPPREA